MDVRRQDAIAEAAGFWDARLRAPDCTERDRTSFAAWRDADPAHRAMFERLQGIVTTLRGETGRADLRSIRDAALALVERRRKRRNLAIAASVMLLGVGALQWVRVGHGESYSTGTGQRSTVTLQDGSSVELNSKTNVDVSFDDRQRSVTLRAGQAIFRVAKAAGRPFVVHAADREIVALGTAFDVRLEGTGMRITLLEGKVAVSQRDGGMRESVVLSPGEQFSSSEGVRAIDVAKVTSWREGRVFLEDLSLADAVAEMNKYSAVQIVLSDPSLGQLRVNGMFRAGEQQAFATALQDYFPLVVERRGATEIVLSGAGAK